MVALRLPNCLKLLDWFAPLRLLKELSLLGKLCWASLLDLLHVSRLSRPLSWMRELCQYVLWVLRLLAALLISGSQVIQMQVQPLRGVRVLWPLGSLLLRALPAVVPQAMQALPLLALEALPTQVLQAVLLHALSELELWMSGQS